MSTETLEEKSCGRHRLETGSIYTLLRRMEHRGLLESEWERAEASGPERRVYKVTKMETEAIWSGLAINSFTYSRYSIRSRRRGSTIF